MSSDYIGHPHGSPNARAYHWIEQEARKANERYKQPTGRQRPKKDASPAIAADTVRQLLDECHKHRLPLPAPLRALIERLLPPPASQSNDAAKARERAIAAEITYGTTVKDADKDLGDGIIDPVPDIERWADIGEVAKASRRSRESVEKWRRDEGYRSLVIARCLAAQCDTKL